LMIGTGGQERGSPVLLLPGTKKRSALGIGASQEGAPAMCVGVVSLQLVESFTMGRAKADVKPPAAVPHITGADT
jgi:hypothetical protein